ncbi:MAG: hypothetical protein DRR08_17285 [Candidatus Parabeggiatoa sp. nov. 2]|nr:MAG: hypothetical protein B6247_06465 [Beggiatoa sp. 4572_84]RKZ58100.1 MAG: hypothetical protein DRR08_17285 [Gammaproteobacteria bacterium]
MLTLGFSQELNLYYDAGIRPQKVQRFFKPIYGDITAVQKKTAVRSEEPVYYLSESEKRVMKKALFRSAKIVHKGQRVN